MLMADLCLDEYTDHGHCGVMRMFSFPSQLAIQTSVSFLSRAESAMVTVYA